MNGDRVVTEGFHERVFAMVRCIPAGCVSTYGDVASALGSPRVARHVGFALAALREEALVPWHRVINAKGYISHGDAMRGEMQQALLENEGIVFDQRGRVDLRRFRYKFPSVD